jgi:hypothetical protein
MVACLASGRQQSLICGLDVIKRYRRFAQLWRSRRQNLGDLMDLQTVEQIVAWSARSRVLGFNSSAIRSRILYSLASVFGATEFIETGTYHGATAICARKSLRLPVRSCEASLIDCWLAKLITCGLPGMCIIHNRSERWLPIQIKRLKDTDVARPVFYLDAHAGIDPTTCPIVEELSTIFQLDHFLILIDDFIVPNREFVGRTYGNVSLGPDLIRPILLSAGIKRVYLPAYSPHLESGHARAGFAILFRSAKLENVLEGRRFPFNLLQSYLLDGRSVE